MLPLSWTGQGLGHFPAAPTGCHFCVFSFARARVRVQQDVGAGQQVCRASAVYFPFSPLPCACVPHFLLGIMICRKSQLGSGGRPPPSSSRQVAHLPSCSGTVFLSYGTPARQVPWLCLPGRCSSEPFLGAACCEGLRVFSYLPARGRDILCPGLVLHLPLPG